jgi:hypothetical protein
MSRTSGVKEATIFFLLRGLVNLILNTPQKNKERQVRSSYRSREHGEAARGGGVSVSV